MKKSKQKHDTSTPATLHDLEVWGGHLAERISSLEVGQEGHTKQLDDLKKISLNILEMITSNESKLSPIPRHEDRIENHEERIEKLEVKVRILQK